MVITLRGGSGMGFFRDPKSRDKNPGILGFLSQKIKNLKIPKCIFRSDCCYRGHFNLGCLVVVNVIAVVSKKDLLHKSENLTKDRTFLSNIRKKSQIFELERSFAFHFRVIRLIKFILRKMTFY